MNKTVLITRPNFDPATMYLSFYSGILMKSMDSHSIGYKSFDGKDATKDNVHKFLLKQEPKFLFLNGHGSDESIEGDKGNIIFSLSDKEVLKDRILYARSCFLGNVFGKDIFENSDGCFIGYTNPFTFIIDSTQSHPSKDKIAGFYLEPSNEIVLSIIKGNKASEAHSRSRNAMLKNMRKLISEPGVPQGMVEALWNNYNGQVIYGDAETRF